MNAELSDLVKEKQALVQAARDEMAKAVVGQKHLVDGLLIGLFTRPKPNIHATMYQVVSSRHCTL